MFKKFNDLKIIYKTIIIVAVVAIVTGINAYLAYRNLDEEELAVKTLGYNILPGVQSLITLYQAEASVLAAERGLLNQDLKDEKVRQSIYESIPAAFKRAEDAWKIFESLEKDEKEKQIWEKFVNDWNNWKETHQAVMDLQKRIDNLASQNLDIERNNELIELRKKCNELSIEALKKFDTAKLNLKELVNIYDEKASQFNQATLSSISDAKTKTLVFILITTVIIFVLIPVIRKIIIDPIVLLDAGAKEIINGNYDVALKSINSKDEIGNLYLSFETMIRKIKDEIARATSFQTGVNGAFFIVDKDLTIRFINQAACDIVGFNKSPEEIIGKLKVKEVFGTDSVSRRAVEGIFIKGEKISLKNRNGEDIPVLVQSGAIYNSKKEIDGSFVFFTDLREVEEKNKEYLKEQIKPIVEIIENLANGDFTEELELKNDDVLYELGLKINKMIRELRSVLENVKEAIQSTASAAEQISSSSEEMAAGAQEQNIQVSEVSRSIEHMTRAIIEMSKNITEVAQMSQKSSQSAKQGTEKTYETKEGMNKIVQASQETAQIIASLTNKTDQIGEITKVIDDIANQTNLLALNAAIEAARAGEQGRGFAVVADEVRKLAERTTKATKEIAETIKSIQLEVKEADKSMANAKSSVYEGMKLTEEIDMTLQEIYQSAKSVSDLIDNIVASSQEQSISADEISKNIENIASVTEQSTTSTGQIASAANNLARLTSNLEDLFSKFKVGEKTLSYSREKFMLERANA
ncbi:MAG: methyl-accepting chemotaxis protein [Melioribacter sp.]|uniref:methyl-accepting chemotaxis protein n=1 Tax=Rosettibacter primus TaxID=3111523 RepID=UPI00247E74FC|nr:methyl-accepting chemotaxis protein [Melioribacter sp.]